MAATLFWKGFGESRKSGWTRRFGTRSAFSDSPASAARQAPAEDAIVTRHAVEPEVPDELGAIPFGLVHDPLRERDDGRAGLGVVSRDEQHLVAVQHVERPAVRAHDLGDALDHGALELGV